MTESDRSPEILTAMFFDRPAEEVVRELAETIYIPDIPAKEFLQGKGKLLRVHQEGEGHLYRVMLAQAYSEDKPNKITKGKRAEEIRMMQPGETVTYKFRVGVLTFIKTRGADNVLLRGIVDEEKGEAYMNATQVTHALGLEVGQRGRLQVDGEILRFTPQSIEHASDTGDEAS